MKKIKFIVSGFLTLGLLQSCRVEREGFPESQLKWIPFKVGDTIRYSDSKDTILMVVNEFYKTGPSYSSGLIMDPDYPPYEGHYYTSKSSLYDYQIKESIASDSYSKIQITEEGDVFEYSGYIYYTDNYTKKSDSIRYVPDTLIRGIHYNGNYVFQKDTVKGNPRISRIIKSSNKGIIEFYDSKYKRKWSLINK